jgi:phospholipase C
MARKINHVFLSASYPIINKSFPAKDIPVIINRVGEIDIFVKAKALLKNLDFGSGNPTAGLHPTHEGETSMHWQLIDPLGIPFTKTFITLKDLDKYKNLRGIVKPWTLHIPVPRITEFEGFIKFTGEQIVVVKGHETIPISSAPPLVSIETNIKPKEEFDIDLYRLGNLSVRVTTVIKVPFLQDIETPSHAKISLIRPNGTVAATGLNGYLQINITQPEIKWCRGQNGVVNKWKLKIESSVAGNHKIFAQVYDTIRIPKKLILDRLEYLLGKNGENVELKANWEDGEVQKNRFTLKLKDEVLAENFEMHNVLDKISAFDTDADIKTGIEYSLYENRLGSESINIRFKNFKIETIKIAIEKSIKRNSNLIEFPNVSINTDFPFVHIDSGSFKSSIAIPDGLPKISLKLTTLNNVNLYAVKKIGPVGIGDEIPVKFPEITFEVGFDIDSSGRISCLCWIDLKTNIPEMIPVKSILNALLYTFLVDPLNNALSEIVEGIFDNLLGGAFKYTAARWKDNAMEFDYVAGVIPERKPTAGYWPIAGHATMGDGMAPKELKNTWKSPLLTEDPNKIKHIVVLMMENRSFDHVLGYLSLERPFDTHLPLIAGSGNTQHASNAINPNVNGLTNKIKETFSDADNKIQHLKFAKFPANKAGLKTQIPFGVGHEVDDVTQQIANNTMKGFVDNFKHYHSNGFGNGQGTEPQDVLGYYTQEELAMYKYLADEYTICDNYFSSHPGPTLPNRMYSLCGDLQKDRNGEPKLDNTVETSFIFSREQNIFDILSQHEVDWKVYESFPSVTMLRMFTKYIGEDKKIQNIDNLEADIKKVNGTSIKFPSVVFIDPAMHDAPANDDHPPADMLHGQHFIKRVYDALKSNPKIWDHTLFVINYDEHGGLFDHVPPKTAEIFQDPAKKPVVVAALSDVSGSSNYKENEKITYGVRVPAFLISPYVEKGGVYHQNLDHTSILKTILIKFCGEFKPFLSDRVNVAHDLGSALKSTRRSIDTSSPDLPTLPDMKKPKTLKPQIIKKNQTMTKSKLSGKGADFHDFLAFLGRTVKPE